MKRKVVLLVLALVATSSLFAQNTQKKRPLGGFYLGADRDTLQYIVASPFDNWFFEVGAGTQTYIGNEYEDTARWSPLDYHFYAELGKWIIPDISVSLNLALWGMHGHTRYGPHPFVDFTNVPTEDLTDPLTTKYYLYQGYRAHGMSITGLVSMEWTNLFSGYEKGEKRKFHVITPVGLGYSMLYGLQKNPRSFATYPEGSFRRNFELHARVGIILEYRLSPEIDLNARADLSIARGSLDWSPNVANRYQQSGTFDLMPKITVGARVNLLKRITKVDARTGKKLRVDVNHVFVPASNERIVLLQSRIDTLKHEMQALADDVDSTTNAKNREVAALSDQIDSIQRLLDQGKGDPNDLRWKIQQLQYEVARVNDREGTSPLTLTQEELDDLIKRQRDREAQMVDLDKQILGRQKQLEHAKKSHPEVVDEIADEIERLLTERKRLADEAVDDNIKHGVKNADPTLSPRQVAMLASEAASRTLELNSLNHQIDSLQNLLRQEMADPMSELNDAIDRLELPMARVYFNLDKWDLDQNARSIIHEFALKIKRGPQDVKYYLIGAADAQTGTVSRNQFLSRNRCQVVYDVLTRSYGINPSQLEMFPLGGITEYSPKEYNRTTLLVLSNNELVKIIDKWTNKDKK